MNTFVCIIKFFSLAYGLPSTPSFPAVEEGVLEDTAENTALANGNATNNEGFVFLSTTLHSSF